MSQMFSTRMAVETSTLWSSSRGSAPLAAMWTTLRNWGEMSYWGLVKTHCPTCPRFTATLWKLQVCFSNLWHWRRWLHITGGALHGDETQTFLVKNRNLSDLRCCRWWWGTTWRRSSCTAWSTGEVNLDICLWDETGIIRTLAYADKDMDGRISFEEFESIIGKLGGSVPKKMVVQVWSLIKQ